MMQYDDQPLESNRMKPHNKENLSITQSGESGMGENLTDQEFEEGPDLVQSLIQRCWRHYKLLFGLTAVGLIMGASVGFYNTYTGKNIVEQVVMVQIPDLGLEKDKLQQVIVIPVTSLDKMSVVDFVFSKEVLPKEATATGALNNQTISKTGRTWHMNGWFLNLSYDKNENAYRFVLGVRDDSMDRAAELSKLWAQSIENALPDLVTQAQQIKKEVLKKEMNNLLEKERTLIEVYNDWRMDSGTLDLEEQLNDVEDRILDVTNSLDKTNRLTLDRTIRIKKVEQIVNGGEKKTAGSGNGNGGLLGSILFDWKPGVLSQVLPLEKRSKEEKKKEAVFYQPSQFLEALKNELEVLSALKVDLLKQDDELGKKKLLIKQQLKDLETEGREFILSLQSHEHEIKMVSQNMLATSIGLTWFSTQKMVRFFPAFKKVVPKNTLISAVTQNMFVWGLLSFVGVFIAVFIFELRQELKGPLPSSTD